MTTKLIIENDHTSNGDVVFQGAGTCEGSIKGVLLPGDRKEVWITDNSVLAITETWPTKKVKDLSP